MNSLKSMVNSVLTKVLENVSNNIHNISINGLNAEDLNGIAKSVDKIFYKEFGDEDIITKHSINEKVKHLTELFNAIEKSADKLLVEIENNPEGFIKKVKNTKIGDSSFLNTINEGIIKRKHFNGFEEEKEAIRFAWFVDCFIKKIYDFVFAACKKTIKDMNGNSSEKVESEKVESEKVERKNRFDLANFKVDVPEYIVSEYAETKDKKKLLKGIVSAVKEKIKKEKIDLNENNEKHLKDLVKCLCNSIHQLVSSDNYIEKMNMEMIRIPQNIIANYNKTKDEDLLRKEIYKVIVEIKKDESNGTIALPTERGIISDINEIVEEIVSKIKKDFNS